MDDIRLFESKKVKTHWDAAEEHWYFSVIDVVSALTDSSNSRDYWIKMKLRFKLEACLELSTNCRLFKMKATDAKMREADCANTQQLLRIIQSIPSSKAQPFKHWLAKVGFERMQETGENFLPSVKENVKLKSTRID